MNSLSKTNLAKSYLFGILILAALLRLQSITSPLVGIHQWRQTDTAAMARNYYESGFHFLQPQIDWRGTTTGEVECEFPLFPFLVALLYKVFGVHDIIGRLLSVCFSVLTVYYLYLLVKDIFDENVALWSAFVYSILPLSMYYGRVFMPEPLMLLSITAGLFYFRRFLTCNDIPDLLFSAFAIMLACLLKIPTLYIGLPLLYLAYVKFGSKMFARWQLYLFALIVLIPVALWYYHAHQLKIQTGLSFGIWEYGTDKWGNWTLAFAWDFWEKIFFTSIGRGHLTWFGLFVFLAGMIFVERTKEQRFIDAWLISLIVYVIIVARGNFAHEYYQLPVMLPASIVLGLTFARYLDFTRLLSRNSLLLLACLAGTVLLGRREYTSYLEMEGPGSQYLLTLTAKVDEFVPESSLMIFVDRHDPTAFYLSHRKGWHALVEELDSTFLKNKTLEGAKYLGGFKFNFEGVGKQQLDQLLHTRQVLWQDNVTFLVKL